MITIYKSNSMKNASQFVNDTIRRLDKGNLDNVFTVIVPDRASLEAERALLDAIGGSFNTQVRTFRRLAGDILPQFDYLSKQSGVMLLASIIQDNKHKLSCFTKGVQTPGFVQDMYDTIATMKYCKISPRMLQNDSIPRGVKAKASDIALLYQLYLDHTKDTFVDSADKLDMLCQTLPTASVVTNGYFFLYDFDNFSQQELNIIEQLMLCSKGVTVACCASDKPQDRHLYLNDIFHGVQNLCKKNNLPYTVVDGTNAPQQGAIAQQIANNLFRYNKATPVEIGGDVGVFCAENRVDEVYNLACQIQQYVRTGMRFKDVFVVTSDVDKYINSVTTVFDQFDIPYFCDRRYCLADHAYSRFIVDYLNMFVSNNKLQNVLSFVKNTLFCCSNPDGVLDSNVFFFENYCLKYNVAYYHKAFVLGQEKDKQLLERANMFREKLQNVLDVVQFPKESTVDVFVEKIHQLIEFCQLNERNVAFGLQQEKQGLAFDSKVTAQAEAKFSQVLEQAQKILGNRHSTLEDFVKVLSSALASVNISVIPVKNDCVVLANMAKARKHDVKFLALLGANYGAMPIIKADGHLLSDKNIADLVSVGINVEPQMRIENKREKFSLFQLLQEPSEKLYVSYSQTDGAERLVKSPFVDEIQSLFTQKGKPFAEMPKDEGVYTQKQAISKLVLSNRRQTDHQKVTMPTFDVLSPVFAEQTSGYVCQKQAQTLQISLGKQLYLSNSQTSISKITTFLACPYQFYFKYGLNARPRKVAKLDAAELGNILHEVLEKTVADIRDNPTCDVKLVAEKHFDNVMQNDFYKAMAEDKALVGLLTLLKQEAKRMCVVIQKQLQNSKFKPYKTELAFGEETPESAPAVKVDYGDGHFMLVGKIDRVDEYDSTRFVVIDYKSSNTSGSYDEKKLYVGEKLQLPIYADAVQNFFPNKIATGFFYFAMHDDFADKSKSNTYVYNGRFERDEDLAVALDGNLAQNKSNALGAKLKKDGKFHGNYARNTLITQQQLQNQIAYAKKLIAQVGKRMTEGFCSVYPYEKKCDFCDYKCVCDFKDVLVYPERKVDAKITKETIDELVKKQ